MLGIKGQFLPKIVDTAISMSSGCDQEVPKNGDRIRHEVAREEDRCPLLSLAKLHQKSRMPLIPQLHLFAVSEGYCSNSVPRVPCSCTQKRKSYFNLQIRHFPVPI